VDWDCSGGVEGGGCDCLSNERILLQIGCEFLWKTLSIDISVGIYGRYVDRWGMVYSR